MPTYKMTIEYDGTGFHGWQVQPDCKTIQGAVEKALETVFKTKIRIIAAGRTDAGVHALGQVSSFRTEAQVDLSRIIPSLNALTPRGVAILDFCRVDNNFNARMKAVAREYRYYLLNRNAPCAIRRKYSWHFKKPLDLDEIKKCVSFILGEHDFSAFRAADCPAHSPICTMHLGTVEKGDDGFVTFRFVSSRFLKHMVRTLVGTLNMVGTGKISSEEFLQIFRGLDRTLAGPSIEPAGLFLHKVYYPGELVPRMNPDLYSL